MVRLSFSSIGILGRAVVNYCFDSETMARFVSRRACLPRRKPLPMRRLLIHRCLDMSIFNRLGLINIYLTMGKIRLLWHSCSFDNHCRLYIILSIKTNTPPTAAFRILHHQQHRRKEQPPSEKGTTNPTRHAVAAGSPPTTFRRRHALAVATRQKRCAISTGVKRPRGDELLELDG